MYSHQLVPIPHRQTALSPSQQCYPQAVSNSQAGSQLANNNRQVVSANIVSASQAGRQAIDSYNPQAVSVNSEGASTVLPRQVVPGQTALIPRQSVLNPWVLTVFPSGR